MKKMMTMMVMLTVAMTMFAKDIKTVVFTTQPQMHCENCENKIKGNLKFEKGVKDIQTNVEAQQVTVKYDADKTTPEKLAAGFSKFGYKATVVDGAAKAEKKSGCSGCGKKKDASAATSGCCSGKKDAKAATGGCCSGKKDAKAKGEKKSGCSCCAAKKDAAKTEGGCCSGKKN